MPEVLESLRNGTNRTIEGISANTGIGADTVSAIIRDLEYHDFVTMEIHRGDSTVYGLTTDGLCLEHLITEIYSLGAEL